MLDLGLLKVRMFYSVHSTTEPMCSSIIEWRCGRLLLEIEGSLVLASLESLC